MPGLHGGRGAAMTGAANDSLTPVSSVKAAEQVQVIAPLLLAQLVLLQVVLVWVVGQDRERKSFSRWSSCSSVRSPFSTWPRSMTTWRTVFFSARDCLATLEAAS